LDPVESRPKQLQAIKLWSLSLACVCRQSVDSAAIAEGALTPWESTGEHIEKPISQRFV
jgi:hypothetical protein